MWPGLSFNFCSFIGYPSFKSDKIKFLWAAALGVGLVSMNLTFQTVLLTICHNLCAPVSPSGLLRSIISSHCCVPYHLMFPFQIIPSFARLLVLIGGSLELRLCVRSVDEHLIAGTVEPSRAGTGHTAVAPSHDLQKSGSPWEPAQNEFWAL